jgi:pimeloyl-ACP methyl ester carboxylesterase
VRLSAALVSLALAGCAATPTPFEVAGQAHDLHWLQPPRPANTLVVLAPGFARRCSHLKGLSLALREAGLAVVCIDAPMAGGNPGLADALAGWLAAGLPAPPGGPSPPRVLVAGHSAGARDLSCKGYRRVHDLF